MRWDMGQRYLGPFGPLKQNASNLRKPKWLSLGHSPIRTLAFLSFIVPTVICSVLLLPRLLLLLPEHSAPPARISFVFFDHDKAEMKRLGQSRASPFADRRVLEFNVPARVDVEIGHTVTGGPTSGCQACIDEGASGGAASGGTTIDSVPPGADGFEQEYAALDAQLKSSRTGTIVFNPPTEMTEGVTSTFEVRISPGKFSKLLRENLPGAGEVHVQQLKVGPRMSVRVYGTGFKVRLEQATGSL